MFIPICRKGFYFVKGCLHHGGNMVQVFYLRTQWYLQINFHSYCYSRNNYFCFQQNL